MSCNNCAVPSVPEVISLISSADESKKKRVLPSMPEVVSLLSSDGESDDEIPLSQYTVGQVASRKLTPPPPHAAGLPERAVPLHAKGAVTGGMGGLDRVYWVDPTDSAEIQVVPPL